MGEKQRKSSAWSDASYQAWWISRQNLCAGIKTVKARTKPPCRIYNARREKSLL